MLALLQRVTHAQVLVNGESVGQIGHGYLVLVCIEQGDTLMEADWMARKIAGLRVMADPDGKMNLALADVGGAVLMVSQFTLAGRLEKGHRPSFASAAGPALAEPLFENLCALIREKGLHVETGRFGADMQVSLTNDGPVTIWLERRPPSASIQP